MITPAGSFIENPSSGSGGGVTSLNSETGAVAIVAGAGVTVTPSGGNITIAATGGGGGAPTTDVYVLGAPDYTNLPNSVVNPVAAFGADVAPVTPGTISDEFPGSSLSGSWTWINQGSAVASVGKSFVGLNSGNGVSSNTIKGIWEPLPAAPWTVIAKLTGLISTGGIQTPPNSRGGMFIMESATGKIVSFDMLWSGSFAQLAVTTWTNSTTIVANQFSGPFNFNWQVTYLYLMINDDNAGTPKIHFSYSFDGFNFAEIGSINRTTLFTTAANRAGIEVNPDFSNAISIIMSCDWIRSN